jgi:hypothetical protein
MSWGVGFVVGPAIGGRFALSPFFSAWTGPFDHRLLPMYGKLHFGPFLFKGYPHAKKRDKISLKTGFVEVKKAFSHPRLKALFYVMFIFCFGWGFFTEFCPVFLLQKLSFSIEGIADFFTFVGLWMALSQVF